MQINRLSQSLIGMALLGLILSSCNSKSNKKQQAEESIPEIEAQLTDQDTLFITLDANDRMQFDKNKIVVFDGQTIVLTLNHTGSMPKTSMGHNFVLIDPEISVSKYARLAVKAKNNDYIVENPDLTLAHTKMIGGGESTEITFKAPEKGTYDFLCSFLGHYSIMKGKFIVQ